MVGFAVLAAAALLGSGCGVVSVSVQAGTISGDGPYRTVWKHGWEQVIKDEVPYKPTATSPGACNRGSTKQACIDADEVMSRDVRALRAALSAVNVPGPWRHATQLTLRGLSHNLVGLNLRIRSLTAGVWTIRQRDVWFSRSRGELRTAEQLLQQAWAAFPEWAQPSPALT